MKLSHEVLLALAYVSQISDPQLVRSRFFESLNGLDEGFIFEFVDRGPSEVPGCCIFPVSTLRSSFGYAVMAENPEAEESELAVFRSAFQFLAVILENRTQTQILESKNTSLAREINQEKSLLRTVLETLPVGVWIMDKDGTIIMANAAGERIWAGVRYIGIDRYSEYKAWGSETGDPLKPDDWAAARAIKTGETFIGQEIKIQCFDGTYKTILNSAAPLLDDETGIIGAVAVNLDITERKQAEKELQQSESHLRTLVQTIPDLVWLKDQDGVFLSCNREFGRFYGATEGEIKGKTDFDFVDRELAEFFQENDRKAISAGQPVRNEEWVTFADDSHRALLETIKTPMYDNRGTLIGVLGIGRDITNRKRAEEEKIKLEAQLQQAQKLESVGRLAGGVAHDYNNMLSVIVGYSEMALEKIDSSDPLYEDLCEIRKAGVRSADITRQLLAFARKQTIAPVVLDLNEAVEGALKMLRRLIGEDIDLAWLPKDGLWHIKIDPSQLDQILANLCVNARDAIDGVGKITIETGKVTFDATYCADHPGFFEGGYVLLAFSDDGCGMDHYIIDKIFEPFFTTKAIGQGTGLGLATVYGIVKQNGGFINVYSEPEKGTTFKIYLVRHSDQTLEATTDNRVSVPTARGETILVVEDEASILKLAKRILEDLGYTVITAGSPHEALHLVEGYQGPISLLITDVVMPEMNGREMSSKLVELCPGLRTLFMSGYTANVIAHRGVLDQGVNFIQKPFSTESMALKVREALDI
jgi:PAS domain S-box-containing protein